MISLDDEQAVLAEQGDDKVIRSVNAFPDQFRQAFTESQKVVFPGDYKKVNKIVVCGMGGSRFTPFIVKELFKKYLKVPYILNDDYQLPGFVDANTLVILSSYSGTTEEVIENAKQALAAGAKVTTVTEGGKIAEMLTEKGLPFYRFSPVNNPSGQPRIGFGYMVGGHIGLLFSLNFLNFDKSVVDAALNRLPELLKKFSLAEPKSSNPAKQLAEKLYGKYPYYIVAEFLIGVGNAIANQTNETAKSISSFRVIPELNHHMMEGLKFPEVLKQVGLFVLFYSKLYSPQIQKRFTITKDVVEQNGLQAVWYELTGQTEIDQAFEVMGLGSFATMYLAALYGQNPAAIPYVDYFKAKLKEMK